MNKILVVDDDREIVDAIEIYLNNEGFEVLKAYDGMEALEIIADTDIDLVMIDIMMPRLDGIRATMKIREDKNIPIIILSAKSEASDKVMGLNVGANDYVTKPFNPLELIARVKSHLRRWSMAAEINGENLDSKILKTGGLELDMDSKEARVDAETVKLTPIEYKIMKYLMENKGKVLSTRQIYETVWEEPFYNSDNTVAVHIRRIREKIEINPKDPMYLKVVWGIGYKVEKK